MTEDNSQNDSKPKPIPNQKKSNTSSSVLQNSDTPLKINTQNGKAVQIARITNGKFHIHQKTLANILLEDRVRNRPVVVVSIAGDMRKGKSFLLNFFLRYLQTGCGETEDWIGRNLDQPLEGFSWRGGSQRDTIGIVMWREAFIVKMPDEREVAVLLMDTQGAFDCEDTYKDSAVIFALSLLTSSIFIYNLHHNLQENNLDNLHVFSNYGSLAITGNGEQKPFQKLVILIRDWSFPSEYPYGKSGGDAKIHKYLVEQKTETNKRCRDFIEESFEERTGFLMPYPGKEVATNNSFRGNISQMDPMFTQMVEEFVPLMIAPNNLIVKRIGGSELNGHTLYSYFMAYADRFSGTDLPDIGSLLEATAQNNNIIAVDNAVKHYTSKMEELVGGDNPHLSRNTLNTNHLKLRAEAINIFDKTPKLGGTEFSEGHKNDLINRIEETFKRYEAQNNSKDYFRRFRAPLYVLLACFVSFALYYLSSATGFTPMAHMFFIMSTVCLGLFVAYIFHLKEGLTLNVMEVIIVSLTSSLIGLFLLYWKQIWNLLRGLLQTQPQQQRHDIH